MKAMIENLKGLIETTKKEVENAKAESQTLYEKCLEIALQNREEGEKIYQQYRIKNDEERQAEYTLQCLRHALASLRDALHEEYDSFKPEYDIQK